MTTEIAFINIDPANAAAFEKAVGDAAPLFKAAQGYHGMALERSIESPEPYRLIVKWETVACHMDLFRNSDAYGHWRELVGHYFVGPVVMGHSETVKTYF
jgi:heme-degrading monooxygenase HmoA